MRRPTLLVDLGLALGLAILVIVIAPGLAVAGMIALVIVIVCLVSFVFDLRSQGKRRIARSASGQPRRPPRSGDLRASRSGDRLRRG